MAKLLLKQVLSRIIGSPTPKRSAVQAAAIQLEVDPQNAAAQQQQCPFMAAQAQPKSMSEMPRPTNMLPFFGSALTAMTKYKVTDGHKMYMDNTKTLGKTYYDEIIDYKCVNVGDPTDVATVFRNEGKYPIRPELEAWKYPRKKMGIPLGIVSADGELWYNYRRAMDRQLMMHQNLYKYVPALNEIAGDYIQILVKNQSRNPEGYIEDLKHEQFRWSLESSMRLLYDKRKGCLRLDDTPPPPDIKQFMKAVDTMFSTTQVLVVMTTNTARFMAPLTLWKHNRAWKTIFTIGRKHIEEKMTELKKAEEEGRLEEEAAKGGFMLSLLDAQRRSARGRDVKLNIDEVYINAMEIMAAGVDTVGTAQQWLMHLLARNPDKQERLRKELEPVKNGMITPEYLSSHKSSYLKACLKESMRLRPILIGTARQLEKDVVLSGYVVPKGTHINTLDFAMASDEKNFPNADKYIPERWLNRSHEEKLDSQSSNQNFSSLPFGFGPRTCIGRRFAETEMYILTSRIVRDYQIIDMNGHLLEPATHLLLMPSEPLKLRFEKLK